MPSSSASSDSTATVSASSKVSGPWSSAPRPTESAAFDSEAPCPAAHIHAPTGTTVHIQVHRGRYECFSNWSSIQDVLECAASQPAHLWRHSAHRRRRAHSALLACSYWMLTCHQHSNLVHFTMVRCAHASINFTVQQRPGYDWCLLALGKAHDEHR